MYNKGNIKKLPKILNDNPKNNVTIKESNVSHPILVDKKDDTLHLVKSFHYKKR